MLLLLHRTVQIAMLSALLACGARSQQDDRSTEEPGLPNAPVADDQDDPGSAPDRTSDQDESDTSGQQTVSGREVFFRNVDLHYYQWDRGLRDLFSTGAVSQLCWPAALANEMAYLRQHRQPALGDLPEVARGVDKQNEEIRYFADLCETDRNSGTTVIQGARCIAKHLATAGFALRLNVAGVDAQWGVFNLFPGGTTTQRGILDPLKIKADLKRGASTILMIGIYAQDASGWRRDRGHYVAVTGYVHQPAWRGDRLELRIMNPANRPDLSLGAGSYETVTLQRPKAQLPLPKDIGFELDGAGFSDGSKRSFVESAVTFDAATQ